MGKKSVKFPHAAHLNGKNSDYSSFSVQRLVMFVLAFAVLGGYIISRTFASTVPTPDHVVIVVEENHAYNEVIGSSSAPYINSLANSGASFSQSFAIEHPSEPNYLDLFSGANQGVTDDSCPHTFSAANLGSELIAAGKTFAGYSEGLPSAGSTTCSSGNYARKHNPWANFTNVPSADNLPLTSFPSDFTTLPTVSFVIPDLCNDMHDCSVSTGDTWLQSHLDAYKTWAMTHNSLLITTFDEDDFSLSNQIPTVFDGQMVQTGQYPETINHYNVLRTIEDMYGLSHAGAAATSASITDVWATGTADTTPPTVSLTAPSAGASLKGTATVSATAADNVGVAGVQFKLDGASLGSEDTTSPYSISWNTTTATNGSHTLTATARDAAGNTTTSAGVAVTVDNSAPTVSITAPTAGATVSGSAVAVSASASDNVGVAGVQFKLDGANLGSEDTSSPYSISWDSTTATNASHSLTAVARDAAGNTTTSSTVSVTVNNTSPDTTAPSVPANLHTTATALSSISLAWSASTDNSGGSGVAGYKLYRGGSLIATITGTSTLSYTDAGLSSNTNYSYTISAYDVAGNESAQSAALSASTTAPVAGDCNGDSHVDVTDLSILLSHYGQAYSACDFNGDGVVNIFDLSTLLSNYGR